MVSNDAPSRQYGSFNCTLPWYNMSGWSHRPLLLWWHDATVYIISSVNKCNPIQREDITSYDRLRLRQLVLPTKAFPDLLQHVADSIHNNCIDYLSLPFFSVGVLMLHISWAATQVSQDINVSGFRVLVDGKQFGTTLHSGVNNVRIKLNLESRVHRISMVTVSAKPYGVSTESNTVDVLTDPFRPFVAFCYGNIHQQAQV